MAFSDDDFDQARAALLAAAFDPDRWAGAMHWLTVAGGGWASQLVGWSPQRGLVLHKTDGLSDDLLDGWLAYDGLDVTKNPRSRLTFAPNSFRVYDENDFSSEEERRKSAIYNEFYTPTDSPYVAAAKFDAIGDILIATYGVRSAHQGMADAAAKQAVGALLPHLKAAIRVQETLENRAAELVAGALENLEVSAVLCRADGQVVAATAQAEADLRTGDYLQVRDRVLCAGVRADDTALHAAIARAGQVIRPAQASTVVLNSRDLPPRLAEVAPMPRPNWAMNLGAAVVVALPRPRGTDPATLIQAAFGLSAAESEIAAALAMGHGVNDIAAQRKTSIATVRTQLKTIFAKTHTASQSELIARIARFIGRPL